jgi:hypothetical protein
MGALNAAVYVVLVRGSVLSRTPAGMKPWFVGMAALYGLATFVFVVQTISALRPTPECRMQAHDELKAHGARGSLRWGSSFRWTAWCRASRRSYGSGTGCACIT